MNSLPVILASDYMSETTHFMHLMVTDISNLFMYLMELLSAIIIVMTTFVAFYKLFTHKPYARVYLLHGQSVGLSFKLGAEILKTITAQNLADIFQIVLLIVIKAMMIWLIEWELKGIEDPYSEEGYQTSKKERDEIKHSIFYHVKKPVSAINPDADLTQIRDELNHLIAEQESMDRSAPADPPEGKTS